MCDRGEQRLRRDQVLDLLEAVRRDYPQIRPVARRTPEEFLRLVESRTSLLVEVGSQRHDGRETPVYEFRHLTIQEYLAAVALIRGHFPGHDPARSLAERIGPLAGRIVEVETGPDWRQVKEQQVTENWREALRLCVAACNDDDVDSALRAILGVGQDSKVPLPTAEEGWKPAPLPAEETRPRAILAAWCLADEPNASQAVAEEVFQRFAAAVGEQDGCGRELSTGLDRAAMEVATSVWSEPLQLALVAEFLRRGPENRWNPGSVSGMVAVRRATGLWPVADTEDASSDDFRTIWMQTQLDRVRNPHDTTAVATALAVMSAAYERKAKLVPGLTDVLLAMIAHGPAAAHAACWAMGWLIDVSEGGGKRAAWQPNAADLDHLVRLLPSGSTPMTDPEALRWLARIAGNVRSPAFVPGLLALLSHETGRTCHAAINALGNIADPRAVEALLGLLTHEAAEIRHAAINALGKIADPRAVEALLGLLTHETAETRRAALGALARVRNDRTDAKLISRHWSMARPTRPHRRRPRPIRGGQTETARRGNSPAVQGVGGRVRLAVGGRQVVGQRRLVRQPFQPDLTKPIFI